MGGSKSRCGYWQGPLGLEVSVRLGARGHRLWLEQDRLNTAIWGRKESVGVSSDLRTCRISMSLCTCVLSQPWSIGQGSEGTKDDRGTTAASNLLDICISVDTNTFCHPLNHSGAVCREGT